MCEGEDNIESKGLDGSNMASKKRKIAWPEEEDNLLQDSVQRFGEGNWATIAKGGNFPVKRTAKQIDQYLWCRMLMWEDGFCQGRSASLVEDMDGGGDDPMRKAFSKMSIQLYNYREGFLLNGPTSLILAFR
ncbi:uncharacterized protein LOC110263389 [Arachis ipaensis]|uniref:uncharacterized protein LOC110263389 n=1 Tax=Arachis ipaensis TaxID=130454 RepID=UPI000A2B244E|nr:uncharacterized protein LOC110263389 [Arachis ipaensis]